MIVTFCGTPIARGQGRCDIDRVYRGTLELLKKVQNKWEVLTRRN